MELTHVADVLVVVVRLGVGGILLAAGILKLTAGQEMGIRLVSAYRLVEGDAARRLAGVLPLLEASTGGFLIAGVYANVFAAVGGLLLAGFAAAVAQALLRGQVVPCGCFGSADPTRSIRWSIVARNLTLAAALGLVVAHGAGALAIDRLPAAGSLTALAAGLAGLAAFAQWTRRKTPATKGV